MTKLSIYIMMIVLGACRYQNPNPSVGSILKLPRFQLLSIDSTHFITSDNMTKTAPTILFYFSPDCEHCQRETATILQNTDKLGGAHLYWISNSSINPTKAFSNHFRLDTIKNIFVYTDYAYSFYKAFSAADVPYMAIYNNDKQLVKVYKGETDVRFIVNTIEKLNLSNQQQ